MAQNFFGHFTAEKTVRWEPDADVRVRRLFRRRVWRAVVCRWIVGAEVCRWIMGAVVCRWIVGVVVCRRIVGAVVCRRIVGAVVSRWIVGAVVCRWTVGAVPGLLWVSGYRAQVASVRLSWRRLSGSGGGVVPCVGQTALDGELQQLVIAQVTVERIILEGHGGSGRSGARDAGCRHDEPDRMRKKKQ